MPRILLVRHVQASFGGADYDVLSEFGERQLEVVARHVGGQRIASVHCGSLVRQRRTAEPIAAAVGAMVAVDPRWDEYDAGAVLGSHSGSPLRLERTPGTGPVSSREFQQVLDGALLAWVAAGADGPAAESWPAFLERVTAALASVGARLGSGETAVVATSSGVVAAICTALLSGNGDTFVRLNRVGVNGGLTKVVQGAGGTTLVSFNDHAHLERADGSLVTYR